MTLLETLETVKAIADTLPGVITSIVGACSVLAAFLPPPDNGLWGSIRRYIDAAAFNIKNARNQ